MWVFLFCNPEFLLGISGIFSILSGPSQGPILSREVGFRWPPFCLIYFFSYILFLFFCLYLLIVQVRLQSNDGSVVWFRARIWSVGSWLLCTHVLRISTRMTFYGILFVNTQLVSHPKYQIIKTCTIFHKFF